MTGRRSLFLCGVSLLALLFGSSKGDDTEGNSIVRPRDCSDHLSNGNSESGVYTIYPNTQSVNVYCDMDTDGGGWTVIQRRGNYSPREDFYRSWNDYKRGFGSIRREFWLGNDHIHALSNRRSVELRIDIQDDQGAKRFAKYGNFQIADESRDYNLQISGYSGDAGDGMKYHTGRGFSTKDRGTEISSVVHLRGAWWINNKWAYVHLNGIYRPGVEDFQAIHWYEWHQNKGLSSSEMKLRQRRR